MKKKATVWLSALCALLALSLMGYPLLSEKLSDKYHSDVQTAYNEAISQTDEAVLAEERRKAEAYNALLVSSVTKGEANASPFSYEELLNTGGVMAYIEIPKIAVYLPVCHGTDADTLEHSVGHLLGSSLPVGGESTHAVLSAHSGMASAKLFSDIELLKKGDVFYLHVLGETLCYRVDAIHTVLPSDTSLLEIEEGKDLVTLVTCTPFGVNTHRLLVRGTRVAMEEAAAEIIPTTQVASSWEQHYVRGLMAGALVLCMVTGIYLIVRRHRHA